MARRRSLTLTPAQRVELVKYRDHDTRPYVRERCAALLKIGEGHSPHWVSLKGLLKGRDPDTVYKWLSFYERAGLAGMIDNQHGGSRRGHL